ncbi:glycoside hydrolase family 43 protein [Marinilactibacillus sp. XAAS-LB27]|uniref:glycoside hydrolase family 43 protein n=1 Tax=Marinilactibacillus sp. XAAS-LB27 TaxID=3114538 RepID=UPI002E17E185|nr:glycoside hydrolase family 43 protein [Marinilactibacillus sp. XAAS-LB27]
MTKKRKMLISLFFVVILLIGVSGFMVYSSGIKRPKTNDWTTQTRNNVSIHDPAVRSVIDENGEETFYAFGTHVAQAKTKDFSTWEVPHMTEYENMEDNILFGNTNENLEETFEWAGYDDADSKDGYNLWAPDVIWNDQFEWSSGSKGAYLMYYSASSTWRRSAIVLMASPSIEGPYTYVDTVVYSGFTSEDSTDGSDRNIQYEGTHLPELISEGKISEFNEKWVRLGGREYNTDYAPNALDPAPFYDENGKFWLVYGSWSGGIHLLELEDETGKPIYPSEDGMTEDGRTIDRYFGTKIFGGYHQSGEGPYIVYDNETGYYNLWLTYGGLAANGGYNMRVFRSETVEGPYIDAKGQSAIFEPASTNSDYGIKLLGNYQFTGLKQGYRAPGHNSVVKKQDGEWLLVFHSRFNQGTEAHEIRAQQMLHNEDNWLVPMPYAYKGEYADTTPLTSEELSGSFEFINHGTENSTEMIETLLIDLTEEGEISGDLEGSWNLSEENLLTITTEQAVYKGIAAKQQDEFGEERIVFSAFGDNNEMIWGIRP